MTNELFLSSFEAAVTNYVGIKDKEENSANVSVFPNPAKDKINLKISLPQNSEVACEIYDLNGKLIYSRKEEILKEDNISIATTNWANGTYIYRILSNRKQIGQGKIVVAQ